MKKLYHKATVHPSPPAISDQLSLLLPTAILALTVALSPEDKEVLFYLLSGASANFPGNPKRNSKGGAVDGDHAPQLNCSCFRCYTSYWVRWDESPNRQRIHEIIDAYEDFLAQRNKKGSGKKDKKNRKASNKHSPESKRPELTSSPSIDSGELESSVAESSGSGGGGGGGGVESGDVIAEDEKGSVRRFVSFIGERIWGGWGQ